MGCAELSYFVLTEKKLLNKSSEQKYLMVCEKGKLDLKNALEFAREAFPELFGFLGNRMSF